MGKIVVDVPDGLEKKLGERGKESGFDDVPQYVAHIWDRFMKKLDSGRQTEKQFSEEEEKEVKERLEALGYLDD